MPAVSTVLSQLGSLPTAVQILGILWVFAMIGVPILGWTLGTGAERLGISIGVVMQTIFVAALLIVSLPVATAIAIIAVIPALGWLFEFIGSRTGVPFGKYEYTDVLKPQIGRVPLVVPAAWLMMIPASAAIGQLLMPGAAGGLQLLVSALAFTAWDLFLDPQMVMWGFWRWKRPGRYFGIPLVNFFGWFLCGLPALVVLTVVLPGTACFLPVWPLFAVYTLTWLFETVAQLAFWKLYGPGIVGFVGMGVFVLLVLL